MIDTDVINHYDSLSTSYTYIVQLTLHWKIFFSVSAFKCRNIKEGFQIGVLFPGMDPTRISVGCNAEVLVGSHSFQLSNQLTTRFASLARNADYEHIMSALGET